MKKLAIAAFTAILFLSMLGCTGSNHSETDMTYMVSSMGFDTSKSGVKLFAEIITVRSDENKTGASTRVFISEGEDPKDAIYKLHRMISKPLMLNHCGLLVLGEELKTDTIREIFEICLTSKDITGAIKLIAVKNVEALMNIKPLSDIALGYEISKAIEQYSEFSGIKYQNRFYEIEAKREGKTKSYSLPYFNVDKENYYIDGLLIYKKDRIAAKKNNDASFIYSLRANNYNNGEMQVDNNYSQVVLKSARYEIEYIKPTLFINVILDIKADKKIFELIKHKMKAYPVLDEDIYFIADRIYRKSPKIWEDIKRNYSNVFKNAEISF